MGPRDAKFVQVPETEDSLAARFFVACQVVEHRERKLLPLEKVLLKHLRACKGKLCRIGGFEVYLVKRNTIRWRTLMYREPPVPLSEQGRDHELTRTFLEYLLHYRKLESATLTIQVLGEVIRKRLAGRKRGVIGGIEFWLVKRNTVRCRQVGHNEHSKYFKPFED